jgi:integrase
LSHQTHLRIKNFLRGVFSWAIASGTLTGVNPMEATKAGGSTKKSGTAGLTLREKKIRASNEHAYTLEEVADMMDKLPEPARTVCAVAAFTGLTRSELRGLKWGDYDGETIKVQRKVWGEHIGAPKTEAREAGIFVVPLLQKILKTFRRAKRIGYFEERNSCVRWTWTTCRGVRFLSSSMVLGSVGTPSDAG